MPDPYNSQAWDRYAYGYNNPLKYVDPDGHNPLLIILAIIGFAMIMSQYPGDSAYAYQNSEGNGTIMFFGALLMVDSLIVLAGCSDDACASEVQSISDASQEVNQTNRVVNQGEGEILSNQTAVDLNKLNHIFNNPEHNLDPLVEFNNGDQATTFSEVAKEASKVAGNYTNGQLMKGIQVSVQGFTVTVRGTIIDGVFKIGTFFIENPIPQNPDNYLTPE